MIMGGSTIFQGLVIGGIRINGGCSQNVKFDSWKQLETVSIRPIYTVRLCRIRQAYDRPTTWIVSFKSNLQLAYYCRVVPKSCRRPAVSLLRATKSYRVNLPIEILAMQQRNATISYLPREFAFISATIFTNLFMFCFSKREVVNPLSPEPLTDSLLLEYKNVQAIKVMWF